MIPGRRARAPEDKAVRREMILDAALELWESKTFQEFSMQALATHLGLAKGTLYLYFPTKEELFLAVYTRLLGAWFDEVDLGLAQAKPEATAVAEVMIEGLLRRPLLARLIAINEVILERNISVESAREFKLWLAQRVAQTGPRIEGLLGVNAQGSGPYLLICLQALVSGLGPMSSPSAVVASVLQERGMQDLIVDLGAVLRPAYTSILLGVSGEWKERSEK